MTSTERQPVPASVAGVDFPPSPSQIPDQDAPEQRKCGKHWCHDWGTEMVIIGVVRCARCGKLSTVADFPAAGDLWRGDHERDMAGCGEEDLPMERGRRRTAI